MIYILFLLLKDVSTNGCGNHGYIVQLEFKSLKKCEKALKDAKNERLFKDGYCQKIIK